MVFPAKKYDRLSSMGKRWALSQEDIYYAIENGMLRVCVYKRADGTPYELTYLGTWNPEDTSKKIWVREDEVLEQIEDVFKQLQLSPESIEKITNYIRNGADYERDYYKTQMEALYKEQTSIKTRLDKLMDFWLEGKITEEEHSEKRKSLCPLWQFVVVFSGLFRFQISIAYQM